MADRSAVGDRDEPGTGDDEHAELLSELDSYDLALAMDIVEASGADAFAFDADGDPDTVFPQSVAAADVDNYITLTGDMHCYIAGYKQTSYPGRVTGGEGVAEGDRIGVEFMTPATTSLNAAEALHLTRGLRGKLTEPLLSKLITAMNPHIEFFDSHNWGYSVVEITRDECTYVAYSVDKTVNSPDADREVVGAYRVPEGVVNLEDITDQHSA